MAGSGRFQHLQRVNIGLHSIKLNLIRMLLIYEGILTVPYFSKNTNFLTKNFKKPKTGSYCLYRNFQLRR